jgi:TPR repeat protein
VRAADADQVLRGRLSWLALSDDSDAPWQALFSDSDADERAAPRRRTAPAGLFEHGCIALARGAEAAGEAMLRRAAEAGFAPAALKLAQALLDRAAPGAVDAALGLLRAAADAGDAAAARACAELLIGVGLRGEGALGLLARAADAGDRVAQRALARQCIDDGDYHSALHYLGLAAAARPGEVRGCLEAARERARARAEVVGLVGRLEGLAEERVIVWGVGAVGGETVADAEVRECVREVRVLAESGDLWGKWVFAFCTEMGLAVARDWTAAAEGYRWAAVRGFAPAQLRFAFCCRDGVGVKQDMEAALRFFRRAAWGGEVRARAELELWAEFTPRGVREGV